MAKAAVEVGAVAGAACLAIQGVIVGASAFDRGPPPSPSWADRLRGQSAGPSGSTPGGARPQLALAGAGWREVGGGNASGVSAQRDALRSRTLTGRHFAPAPSNQGEEENEQKKRRSFREMQYAMLDAMHVGTQSSLFRYHLATSESKER